MNSVHPLVSVGVPVYNGENFLAEAIESLLRQTYKHLEIIIFDNASTDGTEQICRGFAAKDSRIQYHRNEENLGAAPNYNLTLQCATGKYFKWAAHDDVILPTFIERCVEVLENQPAVVLAYPKTILVDESGAVINDQIEDYYNLRHVKPHHRFKEFTKTPLDCNPVFGVIRTDILKRTPGIGPYESSDRVLLGELALLGEIAEIPERLFLSRYHPLISTAACTTKESMAAWFDPASPIRFTRLRRILEYVRSIGRVRLSLFQKTYCLFYLTAFYIRLYLQPERWVRVFRRAANGFQLAFQTKS